VTRSSRAAARRERSGGVEDATVTKKKKRYYAVLRGRTPGIYTQWYGPTGALVQVEGYKDALYKGFDTLEEARRFLSSPGGRSSSSRPKHKAGRVLVDAHAEKGGVVVFTDGGCIENPGPGGWAAIIVRDGMCKEISGGFRLTTNNRMELYACIQALKETARDQGGVTIYTDSQYLVSAVEKGWARKWRSNGWMRDKAHRALNADLWSELLELLEGRKVSFRWVRGHAGQPENERCDELARRAARGDDLKVDEEYEKSCAR